jgi:hypothetical protein
MKHGFAAALILISVVSLSSLLGVPFTHADTLYETITLQALEQVVTWPLQGVSGLIGGVVLDLILDLPQPVGIADSVTINGGGQFDQGQAVNIAITFNEGDTTGATLTVNLIDTSPGGQAFSPVETIQVTNIPADENVQLALNFNAYGNVLIQASLGDASSSADVLVNQLMQTISNTEAPASLSGSSISPTTAAAGDTITAYYYINNPNSFPIQVGLGMSIRPVGTDSEVTDPSNDVVLTVSPGTGLYTRIFSVPTYAAAGDYEWVLAIWSGSPGSSAQFDSTGWQGGLTINSY